MQAWISPAIIAVVVSALVTAAGWFVTNQNSLNLEMKRRREKIRDFQIALRAEIRSELHHLSDENLDRDLSGIESAYKKSKDYSVYVPGLARHTVFDNLVRDIHILPESVIDPLILYSRQRQIWTNFLVKCVQRSSQSWRVTPVRHVSRLCSGDEIFACTGCRRGYGDKFRFGRWKDSVAWLKARRSCDRLWSLLGIGFR